MKREFDAARRIERAPFEQKPAFISQARPAPSPSGDVPKPAPRELQQVPVKPTPAETPARSATSPARSFDQAAARAASQDVKRDFAAIAKADRDKPRQIKPLPKRDRDRDRDM